MGPALTCSNPYCDRGTCRGPRQPKPHPCRACAASRDVLRAAAAMVARINLNPITTMKELRT